MTHFGSKVVGTAAYEKAVREEKGGANVFGTRVRASIPEDGPTNREKRQSEFGPLTTDGAHASDTKGKKTDSISIEELKDVLAINPTFFDSLYEAELARADGARPEALSIFYEIERGIKGQMRQDVMNEIRTLLGEKGVTSAALAADARARGEAADAMAERTRENAQLVDAERIKSLRERADNLKIVQEHDKQGTAASQIALDTQSQADARNTHRSERAETATGKVSAEPDGPVHTETQSRGPRIGVSEGGTQGTGDSGTAKTEETDDDGKDDGEDIRTLDDKTKGELEEYLGDEEVGKLKEKGGSGARGAITHDDLLKAAKRKFRRDAKQS